MMRWQGAINEFGNKRTNLHGVSPLHVSFNIRETLGDSHEVVCLPEPIQTFVRIHADHDFADHSLFPAYPVEKRAPETHGANIGDSHMAVNPFNTADFCQSR